MEGYKLTQDAEKDLQGIYVYGVAQFGEKRADIYYDELFDRFEEIARNPYLYQDVSHIRNGYRRSVCGSNSIYYRMVGNMVEIVAIIGQQDTGRRLL